MLLFVTGREKSDEITARGTFAEMAAAWPKIAAARLNPRSGAALIPAVTRLDLFLAAFSPADEPGESGFSIRIPPEGQWWLWAPSLRRALKELIVSTFPLGPKYAAPFDPCGPVTDRPTPGETGHMRTLVEHFSPSADPSQRPVDPRLWLVLAPPLPGGLEMVFLSTFLRAEPFARVVRLPESAEPVETWLENETDALLAGQELATDGLVADLEEGPDWRNFEGTDESGEVKSRSSLFDLVSGLEEMFASREVLEPGEAYNRLHSHTASEELYILLEGEGLIRVNERALAIKAGQCFGKPRGYDCSTQILNTGKVRMVFLDIGTQDTSEIDLGRYPEHGELLARFAGHRWIVPSEAIIPGTEIGEVYDRRYYRPGAPSTGKEEGDG